MGMKVPAGVDTDDYEPMVLSVKMTNSDEVLENAVLEKPLDGMMVEPTDNTACPGVLIPDVVMLLSDGDSLFDDEKGDLAFEGAPTTWFTWRYYHVQQQRDIASSSHQRARTVKYQLQPQWTVVGSTRSQHGSNVG
jgi:hypothetical protein